jgi:hypothetical protein
MIAGMPPLTLDHVIIAAEDLVRASDELSLVLGRRPSWRGRHPSYGTANVLFRLDNAYLELLAPDPESSTNSAWTGSLGTFLKTHGPGLFSLALQTPHVFETTTSARARGLPVEEPLAGSGEDLDTRAVREWVNARIAPEATRGTRTFFITHRSPPGALPLAVPVERAEGTADGVVGLEASCVDVEAAASMWGDAFELPRLPDDGWRFDLGNATLILNPARNVGPSDRWESLILSVASLEKAMLRLRRLGIAADGMESPERRITVVASGARLVLTEGE